MTSGSRAEQADDGPRKMATGTQAAIITAQNSIQQMRKANRSARSCVRHQAPVPPALGSCVGEAVGGQIKQSLGLIGQIVRYREMVPSPEIMAVKATCPEVRGQTFQKNPEC